MKKANIYKTFDQLFYNNFERDIEIMCKIFKAGKRVLNKKNKQDIFELLIFGFTANWAILTTRLFFESLSLSTKKYKQNGFKNIKDNLNIDTCKAIILGTNKYPDFDKNNGMEIFKKADKYLHKNPFSAITETQRKYIEIFFIIRHYLAHYSEFQAGILRNRLKNINNKKLRTARIGEIGKYLYTNKRLQFFALNFLDSIKSMSDYFEIPLNKKHIFLVQKIKNL